MHRKCLDAATCGFGYSSTAHDRDIAVRTADVIVIRHRSQTRQMARLSLTASVAASCAQNGDNVPRRMRIQAMVSTSRDCSVWRLRDQIGGPRRLQLLLFLPAAAYLLLLCHWATPERLYWEYAGRLIQRPITQGYLEWVDHRAASLQPVETAAPLGHILAPYSEFTTPYPPGALLLFAAVRLPFDDIHEFSLAFGILDSVCVLGAAFVLIQLLRRQTGIDPVVFVASAMTVWIVLTGSFIVTRFDPVVALLVVLAMSAREAQYPVRAGLALGLGASLKIWPLLLLPVFALASSEERQAKPLVNYDTLSLGIGAALGVALPHAVVLAMGTSHSNLFGYLTHYADRPPEVESAQANLLAIGQLFGLTTVRPNFDFGSWNLLSSHWPAVSHLFSILFGVAYLAALMRLFRATNPLKTDVWVIGGFITVSLILCSKVFSGEYLIWMMPFTMLAAWRRRWGLVGCYAAALLLLRIVYREWDSVIAVDTLGITLITAKNAACVAMACMFAREISAATRDRVTS